jgi:proline iminopeptidase
VLYVDYRGRGRSAPAADLRAVTFAGDVADIAALVAALGLGPVHLYGFSYGGWWRRHSPSTTRLWCGGWCWRTRSAARRCGSGTTRTSTGSWSCNVPRCGRRSWRCGRPASAPPTPGCSGCTWCIRGWSASTIRTTPSGCDDVEFFIGGEVARLPDFRLRLRELAMPVLILAGRYDRALYPKYQLEFARAAPQATFVWMERSGSFSHVEEPEEVLGLVARFLGPK